MTFAAALCIVTPLPAQEASPWDVAPAEAIATIGVRDLKELEVRGDALIDDVGVPMKYRLSELARLLVGLFGPATGFNEHGAVTLSAMPPADKSSDSIDLRTLVLSVPVQDRTAFEKRLQVNLDEEGQIVPVDQASTVIAPLLVGRRQGSLYFVHWAGDDQRSESQSALEQALGSAGVSTVASRATLARLSGAHLLLHCNFEQILQYEVARRPLQREIDQLSDPEERAVATEFASALVSLQHLFLGIEIDEGLSIFTRLQFDTNTAAESHRVLIDLAPAADEPEAGEPLSLAGLPDEPVIAAFCSRLSTPRRRLIVRTLGRLLQSPNPSNGDGGLFGSLDDVSLTELQQALLFGMFQEVAAHSQGMKAAAYPNADGTFGVIAIFETRTPDQFVAALRQLTERPPSPQPAEPGDADSRADAAAVNALVTQLRDPDWVVRSQVRTRLLQIGRAAIPALEAAVAGDDLVLREQADSILRIIREHVTTQAGRLLEAGGLSTLQPTLQFVEAAEIQDDHPLDVIRISLPAEDAVHREALAAGFGPDWNQVRVASLSQHVVLTIGTVGPRLSETLRLLESGAPGLAENSSLPLLPQDASRLIAAYLPLSRMVAAAPDRQWNNGEPRNTTPSTQLTGFGLSATADELGFDVRLPVEEVRMLVVKRGWTW